MADAFDVIRLSGWRRIQSASRQWPWLDGYGWGEKGRKPAGRQEGAPERLSTTVEADEQNTHKVEAENNPEQQQQPAGAARHGIPALWAREPFASISQ